MKHLRLTPATLTELKACTKLAIPLAAAQLTDSATGFVDTVMMGWLGSDTLAAGALGAISFNYLLWICASILSAVSPLAAQAYGAGQIKTVRQIFHQGLWLILGLGISATILLSTSEHWLTYFIQDSQTITASGAYLKAIAWGFLPAIGFSMLKGFVCALDHPRPVTLIVIGGILINSLGNYVLMFGKLGLPALGLAGIGWSSTLALWSMFATLLLYLTWHPKLKHYQLWSNLSWHPTHLKELLQVGLPIGGLMAVEAGISAIGAFLAGQLGNTPLAAHQIAYQTAGIMTYQVASGISIATTIRVGQTMGQNNLPGMRLAGLVGITLAGIVMSGFSLAFWLLPNQIISLYLDLNQPNALKVADLARALLALTAIFQIIDGIQVAAAGALRGLKDTQIPMWIGLTAHWCIGLPISYILGMRLGLGVVGLWLGVAAGLSIAAVVLTWRFFHLSESTQISALHLQAQSEV
jgi:multidrug resistance protein, MATE family